MEDHQPGPSLQQGVRELPTLSGGEVPDNVRGQDRISQQKNGNQQENISRFRGKNISANQKQGIPKLTSASEELRGTTPLTKPMVKQNSYEGLALPGIISVI